MPRQLYDTDESELVYVTTARSDNACVLFERHPAHPEGELFIGGQGLVRQAALTVQVVDKINQKELRVLTAEEAERAERESEVQLVKARAHAATELRTHRRKLYLSIFGSDRGFDEHFPPDAA
jgi:hypothetical protein